MIVTAREEADNGNYADGSLMAAERIQWRGASAMALLFFVFEIAQEY